MTVHAASSAESPVDPSAIALVIVRFFGVCGLAAARTPLISAPRAGMSGMSRRIVAFIPPPSSSCCDARSATSASPVAPRELRWNHRLRGDTGDPEGSQRVPTGWKPSYPFIDLASSTLIVLFNRYNWMMIANPTAASPAATVMMKIVKIWPSSEAKRCENATRLMLTAFIISSTAISTVIMLRRMITPTNPMANRVPDNIRYAAVLGIASGTHGLLRLVLGFDALEHVGGDVFFVEGGELAFADDDRADHGYEQEERRDLERDEVVGIQRHGHGLGITDHFAAADQLARHGAVGVLHF